MKREDQTVIRYKQPIKIEKPLQCSRRFLASFVKEIKVPFPTPKIMSENTENNKEFVNSP